MKLTKEKLIEMIQEDFYAQTPAGHQPINPDELPYNDMLNQFKGKLKKLYNIDNLNKYGELIYRAFLNESGQRQAWLATEASTEQVDEWMESVYKERASQEYTTQHRKHGYGGFDPSEYMDPKSPFKKRSALGRWWQNIREEKYLSLTTEDLREMAREELKKVYSEMAEAKKKSNEKKIKINIKKRK